VRQRRVNIYTHRDDEKENKKVSVFKKLSVFVVALKVDSRYGKDFLFIVCLMSVELSSPNIIPSVNFVHG
jgi:hypothetical protein